MRRSGDGVRRTVQRVQSRPVADRRQLGGSWSAWRSARRRPALDGGAAVPAVRRGRRGRGLPYHDDDGGAAPPSSRGPKECRAARRARSWPGFGGTARGRTALKTAPRRPRALIGFGFYTARGPWPPGMTSPPAGGVLLRPTARDLGGRVPPGGAPPAGGRRGRLR